MRCRIDVRVHRPPRSCGRVGSRTPGLADRDWRQVSKPGSGRRTPCVSLDPAAAGQGGRGGQRQGGVYLRGGERLAGQRPIAGQQFFRTPVMIRASSHSELPYGLGGSMSSIRGIRFFGRITGPDHAPPSPLLPFSTTMSTRTLDIAVR